MSGTDVCIEKMTHVPLLHEPLDRSLLINLLEDGVEFRMVFPAAGGASDALTRFRWRWNGGDLDFDTLAVRESGVFAEFYCSAVNSAVKFLCHTRPSFLAVVDDFVDVEASRFNRIQQAMARRPLKFPLFGVRDNQPIVESLMISLRVVVREVFAYRGSQGVFAVQMRSRRFDRADPVTISSIAG